MVLDEAHLHKSADNKRSTSQRGGRGERGASLHVGMYVSTTKMYRF